MKNRRNKSETSSLSKVFHLGNSLFFSRGMSSPFLFTAGLLAIFVTGQAPFDFDALASATWGAEDAGFDAKFCRKRSELPGKLTFGNQSHGGLV